MVDITGIEAINAAAQAHLEGDGTIEEVATHYICSSSEVRRRVIELRERDEAEKKLARQQEKIEALEGKRAPDPHRWQSVGSLAKALGGAISKSGVARAYGTPCWPHLERRECRPGDRVLGNQRYVWRIAPGAPCRALEFDEEWTADELARVRDGDQVDRDLIAGLYLRCDTLEGELTRARDEAVKTEVARAIAQAHLERSELRAEEAVAVADILRAENDGLEELLGTAHQQIKALEMRLEETDRPTDVHAVTIAPPRHVAPSTARRWALGLGACVAITAITVMVRRG